MSGPCANSYQIFQPGEEGDASKHANFSGFFGFFGPPSGSHRHAPPRESLIESCHGNMIIHVPSCVSPYVYRGFPTVGPATIARRAREAPRNRARREARRASTPRSSTTRAKRSRQVARRGLRGCPGPVARRADGPSARPRARPPRARPRHAPSPFGRPRPRDLQPSREGEVASSSTPPSEESRARPRPEIALMSGARPTRRPKVRSRPSPRRPIPSLRAGRSRRRHGLRARGPGPTMTEQKHTAVQGGGPR